MTDLYRALATPRKTLAPSRALIEHLCYLCGPRLTDTQVEALHEAHVAGGLLASMGVGLGKSLVSLLLATVMDKKKPLLLIKSNLVANLWNEFSKWRQHYRIVPFQVFTYDLLSVRPHQFASLKFDLVVCDEAHLLKNLSARTLRFLQKIVSERPAVAVLTGTLTTRSVADYAHTAEAALKANSPIPYHDDSAVGAWRRVMGARPDPQTHDWAFVKPLCVQYHEAPDTTGARQALFQHLSTAAGVVMTNEPSCRASLYIETIKEPKTPAVIVDLIDQVLDDQVAPDGTRLSTFEADIIARQLPYGFWYKRIPVVPSERSERGVMEAVDLWRIKANAWGRAVREWLSEGGAPDADSPATVRRAAKEGRLGQWAFQALTEFEAVEHTVAWRRETIWIDKFFVEAQQKWLAESASPRSLRSLGGLISKPSELSERGAMRGDKSARSDGNLGEPWILWYRHQALGEALGLVRYDCSRPPRYDAHTCAMSIPAMHQGHNLQAWSRMRVLQPPSDAGVWQQLIARVHRMGQEADEVVVQIMAHNNFLKKTLDNARRAAEYVEQTTGERQRLSLATWVDQDQR